MARGSIAFGKVVDFVVLNADLLAVHPERIQDVVVLRTIIGGREVFNRERRRVRRSDQLIHVFMT